MVPAPPRPPPSTSRHEHSPRAPRGPDERPSVTHDSATEGPARAPVDRLRDAFLEDVLEGLSRRHKSLPCRYFYDARGSRLFERICEQPEYYLTRTELEILRARRTEMAEAIGPRVALVEPGAGSAAKTRLLLDALEDVHVYVPVDISAAALDEAVARHRRDLPRVPIHAVHADFTVSLPLPALVRDARRTVVFFPGSTFGNFPDEAAQTLLRRFARAAGEGGGLLLGVDLVKDPAVLEAAYDDAAGVTAEFDRNILVRMRSELGADVDPQAFAHRARWDPAHGAVESSLVSLRDQAITVAGRRFALARGEAIHTESSRKYTLDGLRASAARAGWTTERTWLDDEARFAITMLRVRVPR